MRVGRHFLGNVVGNRTDLEFIQLMDFIDFVICFTDSIDDF